MTTVTKTEEEKALELFTEVDAEYKKLLAYIESGEHVGKVKTAAEWQDLWAQMKDLMEERNVKLQEVKNRIRSQVLPPPNTQRGIEGKPETRSFGAFKVSSVTRRSLDVPALLERCKEQGVEDELKDLTFLNSDGQTQKAIWPEWKSNFDTVVNWLRGKKMETTLAEVYREKEDTPQVKGPKPVGFMGEPRKD